MLNLPVLGEFQMFGGLWVFGQFCQILQLFGGVRFPGFVLSMLGGSTSLCLSWHFHLTQVSRSRRWDTPRSPQAAVCGTGSAVAVEVRGVGLLHLLRGQGLFTKINNFFLMIVFSVTDA